MEFLTVGCFWDDHFSVGVQFLLGVNLSALALLLSVGHCIVVGVVQCGPFYFYFIHELVVSEIAVICMPKWSALVIIAFWKLAEMEIVLYPGMV
jgi:hypothetical protein